MLRGEKWVSEELGKLLGESGCTDVFIGAESLNDEILRILNKGLSTESISNAIKNLSKYVKVTLGLMLFIPSVREKQLDEQLRAIEQEIPVIAVRENRNNMKNNLSDYPFKLGKLIYVENYLEAVGIMAAMKAGIAPETVRRPISFTNVIRESQLEETVAEYRDKKIDEGKDKNKAGFPVV